MVNHTKNIVNLIECFLDKNHTKFFHRVCFLYLTAFVKKDPVEGMRAEYFFFFYFEILKLCQFKSLIKVFNISYSKGMWQNFYFTLFSFKFIFEIPLLRYTSNLKCKFILNSCFHYKIACCNIF